MSGIVGAGGNVGAIAFTLLFLSNKFSSTAAGFRVMGWVVMACAFAIWAIRPELLNVDPLDATVVSEADLAHVKSVVSLASLEAGEGAETEEDEAGVVEAKVSV